MPANITTQPTQEPVTLTAATAYSRYDDSDQDDTFAVLIRAAREYAEAFQHRVFITQTWTLTLSAWADPIILPNPPLQSVTTVKYLDVDGVQQTVASSVYTVSTVHEPGRITLAYGQIWPTLRGVVDQIEIEYIAGYGAGPDNVPRATRMGIKQLVAHWFCNRTPVVTGATAAAVPLSVDAMLSLERLYGDL